MGNTCIIIRTVGCHQNNLSSDAERVGARLVAELHSLGHSILSASCETGGSSIQLWPADDMGHTPPGMRSVTDIEFPGQCAYERYCAESGGKSLVSGAELPGWVDLKPDIKAAWMAAVDCTKPRMVK